MRIHIATRGGALETTMSVLDQERTNRLAVIRAGIGRRLKAFHEHELHSPMPDRIGHLLSELKCVSKKGTGDSATNDFGTPCVTGHEDCRN